MRLLIAGGAGYLGSVLIPKLLERCYKVDVVDLFWFGNHLPRQVGVLNKDTGEDLEPYDQVIFLAGLSNDPMAEYSPSKNFIFNAAAPAYLGYIAKIAKVKRYIYASSCSVYGYTENELFDENRPVSSSYPYGISKLQGEQAVQLISPEFSVISLREGTISGYSRSQGGRVERIRRLAGRAARLPGRQAGQSRHVPLVTAMTSHRSPP
jgi:nucleoside-diphosphate-sugar epimerase